MFGFDVLLRNGFVMTKGLRWTDFSGFRRDALIFQMMPAVIQHQYPQGLAHNDFAGARLI